MPLEKHRSDVQCATSLDELRALAIKYLDWLEKAHAKYRSLRDGTYCPRCASTGRMRDARAAKRSMERAQRAIEKAEQPARDDATLLAAISEIPDARIGVVWSQMPVLAMGSTRAVRARARLIAAGKLAFGDVRYTDVFGRSRMAKGVRLVG